MYLLELYTLIFSLLILVNQSEANNCCPQGQVVLVKSDECWDPKTNVTNSTVLTCKETVRFGEHFTVMEDGILHLAIGDFKEDFEKDVYCVANVTSRKDVLYKNITLKALMCIAEDEKILDDRVLGYCMILSIIFFVPTALIYTALPELRDVQGKSIINFCISIAIGQGILAIMKLMEYSDMALCATRGFLAYFFLIVAFFWTNAISIQILLNTRRPSTLDYSWYEFKWYFMYAWGCPAILTICMAIVNFHPGDHAKPGIGLNHCWFFNTRQQWYYMFSVMSILLAANIGIFIYTSSIIWRLSFSSSHLKALKYKFVMSVRLIILMGLPWVFEMVGSIAGENIILTIIDILNSVQGLFTFLLLVVFRRRVVKLMYKHGWLNCISGYVERHLAVEDDEENVVQHTDVPMSVAERTII